MKLGDDTILPGETYSFDLPSGDYDIRLEDCTGDVILEEVNIRISGIYELDFSGPDRCRIMNEQGLELSSQAQYAGALSEFRTALACYREAQNRRGEGISLHNIGMVLYFLGQHEEALDYTEEALNILREANARRAECMSLNQIGEIYAALGQYDEALEYCQEALSVVKSVGYSLFEGRILHTMGTIFVDLGQYAKGLDYSQQAQSIQLQLGDSEGMGGSLNNIAVAYYGLGRFEDALDYCQRALAIRQTIGDRKGESESHSNMGIIYAHLGRYEDALDHLHQAVNVQRGIGLRAAEGASLSNIGFVYEQLEQYDEALDYLEEALTVRQEIGDRAGEGTTLNNIGIVHGGLGDYEKALDFFEQALTVAKEVKDPRGEGICLSNIGYIYFSLKEYEEALDYYEQALSVHQKIGDRRGAGTTLNNIGMIHGNLGKHEEALPYYEESLRIAQGSGDRAAAGITLNNLGSVYREMGRREEALAYYEQAIAVIETMRSEITVEELKSSLVAGKGYVYDHIISLLVQMGRPDEAFYYIQRAKARTFLDQLANVRVDPRATDDQALLAREQELLGEIRALEAMLSGRGDFATLSLDDAARGSPPPLTGEQRIEARERMEAAYRDYEQVLTQIKLTNPQYASMRSVQASTLITVQQTLPPDVTLLEYYVGPSQTLAFVITRDDFHATKIATTQDALYAEIESFDTEIQESLAGIPKSMQNLYDLLIAPVEDLLETDALMIAPHSVLHYLSFGALHNGEHYLVEDYDIAYLPSASVLRYVLENARPPSVPPSGGEERGGLLALANPEVAGAPYLNHAVAETEAVATLFDAQPITGSDATETQLVSQASQAGLVHVAAHGEFNPVAPQFSRIYLAPDDENDGYLEVREVFNLELPQTDLVTLSACETQLGELSAGDELVGLSRAFIYAGTPSLVASLWSVDDESTRFLMERFYGYLKEGRGKAAALRQAQLDTMAQEEWASPYYWAAFTLIGDTGELDTDKDKIVPSNIADVMASRWFWIGAGIVVIVLFSLGLRVWVHNRQK